MYKYIGEVSTADSSPIAVDAPSDGLDDEENCHQQESDSMMQDSGVSGGVVGQFKFLFLFLILFYCFIFVFLCFMFFF